MTFIVTNIFQENDYTHLTINKEYNSIEKLYEIEEKLFDYYHIYDHIKEIIDRIKKIIKGKLKYEARREFTTNLNAKKNKINQYGDIKKYSCDILRMTRGGTNRQSTGIYGFSGDDITIYVDTEKEDDPLPSITFSQYIGSHKNFLSSSFKLKKGKNILKIPDFDISEIKVKLKSGGPMYIENTSYSKNHFPQIIFHYEFKKYFLQYFLSYFNHTPKTIFYAQIFILKLQVL